MNKGTLVSLGIIAAGYIGLAGTGGWNLVEALHTLSVTIIAVGAVGLFATVYD